MEQYIKESYLRRQSRMTHDIVFLLIAPRRFSLKFKEIKSPYEKVFVTNMPTIKSDEDMEIIYDDATGTVDEKARRILENGHKIFT